METSVVLSRLQTGPNGLSDEEAVRRLEVSGPNHLPRAGQRSAWFRLLLQFHNLLIYVLMAAGVLAAAIGHFVDAMVVFAVVALNAIIGFVQEGRAERALEAIRSMIDPRASVIRNGRRITVASDDVVPGDLVMLEAGDRVPADVRLIKARSLRIDEAILTGESVAVDKTVTPVAPDAALGDRHCSAFSGTFVAAGLGSGVVTATGASTELGRISALLDRVDRMATPLLRQMDRFARQVTFVVLAVSLLVFAYAVWAQSYPLTEAFMVVVGLVVAAIPEGLPAVMTITLAVGVRRMARRNAIIRRLPAVETLGAVSVICSDKTGTLTRNEMTVRSIATAGGVIEVEGAGYRPEGGFRVAGEPLEARADPVLQELSLAAMLCNDAAVRQTADNWIVDGDPMEGALLSMAFKAGHDENARRRLPRLDEIPFDSRHRYMATLHVAEDQLPVVYVKGAPERILEMCDTLVSVDGPTVLDASRWRQQTEALAAQGQRVLGLARLGLGAGCHKISPAGIERGLSLLGLVGLIDPPRPEAIAAVSDCRAAGIRVKMITGDHAATARAIAVQLKLDEDPKVLTGQQLDGLDSDALRAQAQEAAVFARTSPEHKLRLVEALQADGSIIAMTGDGVNDAPALKRADVGVAMGGKGTEAAKEAADVVLADDNFASIVAAVREGRTVYDNLVKVIAWTLPTNGGETLAVIAAIFLGITMPMSAVQILWVNLVTEVTLGLVLAFEPAEPGVMGRKPRPPNAPLLSPFLVWRVVSVSVLFAIGAFGIFYYASWRGHDLETARTMVVNLIVVFEVFYLFAVRYLHVTSFTLRGALGTRPVLVALGAIVVAQFAFTYVPAFQAVFGTRPIGLVDGMVIVGTGVVLMLVLEAEKAVLRRTKRFAALD